MMDIDMAVKTSAVHTLVDQTDAKRDAGKYDTGPAARVHGDSKIEARQIAKF